VTSQLVNSNKTIIIEGYADANVSGADTRHIGKCVRVDRDRSARDVGGGAVHDQRNLLGRHGDHSDPLTVPGKALLVGPIGSIGRGVPTVPSKPTGNSAMPDDDCEKCTNQPCGVDTIPGLELTRSVGTVMSNGVHARLEPSVLPSMLHEPESLRGSNAMRPQPSSHRHAIAARKPIIASPMYCGQSAGSL
jgi:hypothetical protein